MTTQQITMPEQEAINDDALEEFRASLHGTLLNPDEAGYDAARTVWNGMIDKRPALILQPSGVADVISAVKFARERGLPLAIKGGGHNVAGNALCDAGLLLDMSSMRAVRVDPRARTAYVEGGALWSDFDHEAAAFNLVTTGGAVSTTGVAGLTLGGGIGWLNAKFGMACDNVLAFDLVLADGSFVRASADEHPDLFWALKGGGGNFGVVTGFLFQLHPFNHEVLAGGRFYPVGQAREILEFYRAFTPGVSTDVVVYAAIFLNPETGENAAIIAFCHAGDLADGEREMAPVRELGNADLDIIAPMPYTAWQQALDSLAPHGRNYYWKAVLFTELSDAALDIIAEHGARKPNVITSAIFEQYHGAFARPGKTDTAFWHRDARYQLVISAAWDDPSEQQRCIQWARELHDALQPHGIQGKFLNFNLLEDGERPERVRASFGDNYARLVQVKTAYDPANLFRTNNNINPSGDGGT